MKRMTYIVMALALVLGLAQCKKEEMPASNQVEGISIILEVNNGASSGSKVNVEPNDPDHNYATVSFETGDVIYVGNNGQYRGYLTYDGTKFAGTISGTDFNDEDYLHFYFLGGVGFTPTIDGNTATVNISNQTEKYPVISYAHSKDFFSSDRHSYKAKLQNYCSIVKFTTNSIPTATAVTVKGMKNTVSVNFGANNAAEANLDINPYTPDQSGDGDITLHAESTNERWAILLEQNEVSGATVTASGYNNSTCNVPKISNNTYNNSGVGIEMTTTITWNSSTVNGINISNGSFTNSGITVTSNSSNAKWNYSGVISSIDLKNNSDKLTFSTGDGTIKEIVITLDPSSGSVDGTPSSGWSYAGLPYYTLTWTGSSSSVDLSGVSSKGFPGGGISPITSSVLKVSAITKVEFTVL